MNKNIKLVSIILIILVILFGAAYFSNSLSRWGLCRPGTKLKVGLAESSCYKPSIFEGKVCEKRTDCGTGNCWISSGLFDQNNPPIKGVCRDSSLGCNSWLNDSGKAYAICAD